MDWLLPITKESVAALGLIRTTMKTGYAVKAYSEIALSTTLGAHNRGIIAIKLH